MSEAEIPDPPESPAGERYREMDAGEAYRRLSEGETLTDIRVTRLKFSGVIDFPVRMRNCSLASPVFQGAEFKHEVSLAGCTIDRPRFRNATRFGGDLDLSGATLNRAVLPRVTVAGAANFSFVAARGKCRFSHCHFEGKFTAWEAKFTDWVDFDRCHGSGEFDFRSAHCDSGLVFKQCRFDGDFVMRGTSVAKKFDLGESHFEKKLDLSKAKLFDFSYLENIKRGDGMTFACWNALADRVIIRPEQLEGRVASEAAGDHETAMQEYGLLKRGYENLHRYDYEDWAFYKFKVNQRKAAAGGWRRPWTAVKKFFDWLFLDVGCGYGTDPFRAVRAALVIILLFGAFFTLNIGRFYADKLPFDAASAGWGDKLIFGLFTSASVFTSGLGGPDDLTKGWMNLFMIAESLIGTLLFGLFIVAFSRKVIR